MTVETIILMDVTCKDGKKISEKAPSQLINIELAHIEDDGFIEDYDGVIKAVEAHFLEDYGAEMHYMVEFDIINQDEICEKLE